MASKTITAGDRWIQWYLGVRDGLVEARGVLGKSSTGNDLPKLTGTDALCLIGIITGPLAKTIKLVSAQGVCWQADFVGTGGEITTWDMANGSAGSISAEAYLGNTTPDPSRPWRRKLMGATGPENVGHLFEPARPTQLDLIGGVREAIIPWQELVDGVSDSLQSRANSLIVPLSLAQVNAHMSAFYRCALSISASADYPPQDERVLAKEAAKHALDVVAHDLGQAAADAGTAAGEVIGKTAGGFATGFFENAGLTALVVGGTAVYLAFR